MSLHSLLLLCALVFLLCVGESLQSADLDQHQLELKEHYDHLTYIAEFKCHHPQSRVIPINQLLSQSQIHGKAYFPDVTVLHRCDFASGCCVSAHHCAPVQSHLVQLPFKVTFLENTEHHKKGSWILEFHQVYNHTECACTADVKHTPGIDQRSKTPEERDKPLFQPYSPSPTNDRLVVTSSASPAPELDIDQRKQTEQVGEDIYGTIF